MRALIYILILFRSCFCNAQVNLIPNPSFELYDTCPDIYTTDYPNGTLKNWFNSSDSSPDYYNACSASSSSDVPSNSMFGGGFQLPNSGNAFCGLFFYSPSFPNQREYLYTKLLDSLKKDSLYKLQFYVNLHNKMGASVNEFTILLSKLNPYQSTISYLSDTTYIKLTQAVCVNDTLNWTKFIKYYKATGGEKYIAIGNFISDSVFSYCSTGFGSPNTSYYYFDDFYLGRVTDTTGLNEIETKISFDIYPNPANETIIVESNSPPGNLYVTDVMGKQLLQLNYTSNKSYFNIAHLPNGIYFIRKDSFCRKLIVQR